jgi:uncharacterized protein YbjT (DUF2867 family)
MKIVVIGANGLIGCKLVTKLDERGHETVAASPKTGVDTLTGEGLAAALAGAVVVVDVLTGSSLEDTSIRNLLAAEAAAGVGHHVALSAVGTQQALIECSSIPYSIVRATNIAAEDVAGALAGVCVGPPLNGIVKLAGSVPRYQS